MRPNRPQPSRDQLKRWMPVLKAIRDSVEKEKNTLAGFRLASEFAMTDAEFVTWWICQAEVYDEPVRGRALSFLRRLANRADGWNFDLEFRQSFN